MKTIFQSDDGELFTTEEECRRYEFRLNEKVALPVVLVEEAIRQATPYMVSAKERRDLAQRLARFLPTTRPDENQNQP